MGPAVPPAVRVTAIVAGGNEHVATPPWVKVNFTGTTPRLTLKTLVPSEFNLKSKIHRGHSSVGRAPALQAGSQGFESPCLQSLKGVEATSPNREHFRITSGSIIPLPPKSFSICDFRLSI